MNDGTITTTALIMIAITAIFHCIQQTNVQSFTKRPYLLIPLLNFHFHFLLLHFLHLLKVPDCIMYDFRNVYTYTYNTILTMNKYNVYEYVMKSNYNKTGIIKHFLFLLWLRFIYLNINHPFTVLQRLSFTR